jgi:hypothetical protein
MRTAEKIRRNVGWLRSQGWAGLLEEHDWNPFVTVPRRIRKAIWRIGRQPAGAQAVYLIGAQRSGTNMMVHGLDEAAEVDVYNEGNGRAFKAFQLRPDDEILRLVDRSRADFVLMKPLCDSDRLETLLHLGSEAKPPRLIWAYRGFEDRVRSYVLKFGDSNLRELRDHVRSSTTSWQVRGLSEDSEDFLRGLPWNSMSAASGAAAFWYVRNRIVLESEHRHNGRLMLASYERFVSEPEPSMRALCNFIGFSYRHELIAHISPRWSNSAAIEVDSQVRQRCELLEAELDALYARQRDYWLSNSSSR